MVRERVARHRLVLRRQLQRLGARNQLVARGHGWVHGRRGGSGRGFGCGLAANASHTGQQQEQRRNARVSWLERSNHHLAYSPQECGEVYTDVTFRAGAVSLSLTALPFRRYKGGMNQWPSFVRGVVVATALVLPVFAADRTTIKGEVVELECSLNKGAEGKGDAHAACAMSCARNGQAMAILTADDAYLIEGDYTANKNAKLLDFVAKKVEAKGSVTERDGKKIINIAAMMVQKAEK